MTAVNMKDFPPFNTEKAALSFRQALFMPKSLGRSEASSKARPYAPKYCRCNEGFGAVGNKSWHQQEQDLHRPEGGPSASRQQSISPRQDLESRPEHRQA